MTELKSKTYGYPLKFFRYSEGKIIAFLNEEVVYDYVPQVAPHVGAWIETLLFVCEHP